MTESYKEIKRIKIMELLVNGKMTNQEAAESLRGRTSAPRAPQSSTMAHAAIEVREALSGLLWVVYKG
ncbi:MAG: hypothetical protein CSA35_09420 [Dethiosulfovibrio peptidovorans]|nr:MAG: hypothetical protein CSA35_09420 [Dethiosulfovibrio peptidovorans]